MSMKDPQTLPTTNALRDRVAIYLPGVHSNEEIHEFFILHIPNGPRGWAYLDHLILPTFTSNFNIWEKGALQ